MKVTLREKKLNSGNISLYLDIYHEGHRWNEFLKLYIKPEYSSKDRTENRAMREVAEKIKNF